MIHLVRSAPIADSSSESSEASMPKKRSVVRLEPRRVSTEQTSNDAEPDHEILEGEIEKGHGEIDRGEMDRGEMAHRGLVVLENLSTLYPLETQPAIAPAQMSPSMKELYECLTVQQVSIVNREGLSPTVLEEVNQLTAESKFLQDYPPQFLQTPSIPIRRKSMLPPLPFLEVGSGLLAFTIVSGVVVADGLKQSRTIPTTTKRTEPISAPREQANRAAQVSAAMSDMEILKSGRTLPMPKNAGMGLGMGMANLTPEQLSQLALQQAIAASKVGTVGTLGQSIAPPTDVIPPLTTFASAPTGTVNGANPVPQQPSPQQPSPQQPPISMTPPPQRQSDRQPQRLPAPPIVREPIDPPRLPVPQRPELNTPESPVIVPPSPMPTASPVATPIGSPTGSPTGSPIVQQSMMPVPANSPRVDNTPRPVTSGKDETPNENPVRSPETVSKEASLKMTPQVLSSMRPSASDLVLPTAPAIGTPEQLKTVVPAVQPTVELKDLVFNREVL